MGQVMAWGAFISEKGSLEQQSRRSEMEMKLKNYNLIGKKITMEIIFRWNKKTIYF